MLVSCRGGPQPWGQWEMILTTDSICTFYGLVKLAFCNMHNCLVPCNHCVCTSVVITLDSESCLWWLEDIPDTLGRFYGLLTRGNKVLIVPYLDLIWFHFPTSDHVNYFYWSPAPPDRGRDCTDEPWLGLMVRLSMMCWDKHCSHATCIFTHCSLWLGIEL